MKCPKCQYIGFDDGDRCRNCGYEFSLASGATAPGRPIDACEEPSGPPGDPPLTAPGSRPTRLGGAAAEPKNPIANAFDLPLFSDRRLDDDMPLVTVPAVPRAPVAVRRSAPAPRAHVRAAEEPELDLGLPEFEDRVTPAERQHRPSAAQPRRAAPAAATGETAVAGAGARLIAALLDGLLLGVINAAVLYFTLQLTGVGISELRILPPVPLFGFLLLLCGGYFVSFTAAGGQTIGKMAAGIRVVPMGTVGERPDRVPLGHAIVRAAGYAVSVLPAGLGYLPALFGHDRRAVHDRLADTRVVKA